MKQKLSFVWLGSLEFTNNTRVKIMLEYKQARANSMFFTSTTFLGRNARPWTQKKNLSYTMQPTFFWPIYDHPLKVAFFKKCDSFFKSPKKIFQKIILSLKFKFPANYSKMLLARNLKPKILPKNKWMNLFCLLFGFHSKQIIFVLGESMARQSCFWF